MRLLNRRSFLITLVSLLSISASMADGIIVLLSGATADHDQRTGNPVVKLIFSETSREKLRTFSAENVGQKVELRVAGNVILTPVLREPLSGSIQISDIGWTDQTAIDLAQRLSKPRKEKLNFGHCHDQISPPRAKSGSPHHSETVSSSGNGISRVDSMMVSGP